MTTEEKAKAYDEALKWMRELYPRFPGAFKEEIEHYFPELRESEDERIRKAIVELMTAASGAYLIEATGFKKEQFLSYLEKQKEQIPYIDFVIKPHKGNDNNPYDMSVSKAQEYAFHRGFDIPFNDGEVYVDERHMTQTIGNILRWADEHPKEQKPEEVDESTKRLNDNWMKQHFDDYKEQKPVEWSKQQVVNALTSMLNERITPFHQKSLDGTIGDKEKMFMDALVEMRSFVNSPSFDIGKENSAEWSEEDEKMLTGIIERGSVQVPPYTTALREEQIEWLMNRLKSLRPQPHWKKSFKTADLENSLCDLQDNYHDGSYEYKVLGEAIEFIRCTEPRPSWKPSEEQMEALLWCVAHLGGADRRVLAELYEHLKMYCK